MCIRDRFRQQLPALEQALQDELHKLKQRLHPKARVLKESNRELAYEISQNPQKQQQAQVSLNQWQEKEREEKRAAVETLELALAEQSEKQLVARQHLAQVENQLRSQLSSKKRQRTQKIAQQQQACDAQLQRLDVQIDEQQLACRQRKDEIVEQQQQELQRKGADTNRLEQIDQQLIKVKQELAFIDNKRDVVAIVLRKLELVVDPTAMFDVQVKRIHEYKRQHLNVLHIITLYNRIKANPDIDITPRLFIFGGKAAPGYFMAKRMIKLITSVARVVNNDPDVRDRLKVHFIANYNVKIGHVVYPMTDLSEQISQAGMEASGTGNMKFSMNGALTIGTLDGANVEIREEVGAENFFLFGLNVDEVMELQASGYHPMDYYNSNAELKNVIDLIASGHFSHGDRELFRPIVDSLLYDDQYTLFADYQDYIDCQDRVSNVFTDTKRWTSMSILNTARMGKFSSDRSIADYSKKIWDVQPFPVELKWQKLPENGVLFAPRTHQKEEVKL